MRSRPERGLVIGSLGAVVAFVTIQIERIAFQPQGIDATAQAEAQATRLNVYGAIMIAAALLAVVSGIILVAQRRSRPRS